MDPLLHQQLPSSSHKHLHRTLALPLSCYFHLFCYCFGLASPASAHPHTQSHSANATCRVHPTQPQPGSNLVPRVSPLPAPWSEKRGRGVGRGETLGTRLTRPKTSIFLDQVLTHPQAKSHPQANTN